MDAVDTQVHTELTSYCGVGGGAPGQPSHQKLAAVVINGTVTEVHCELSTGSGTDTGQEVAH